MRKIRENVVKKHILTIFLSQELCQIRLFGASFTLGTIDRFRQLFNT